MAHTHRITGGKDNEQSFGEQITALCAMGEHGSPLVRTVAIDGWSAMWTGSCAGSAYSIQMHTEVPCDCPCHKAA